MLKFYRQTERNISRNCQLKKQDMKFSLKGGALSNSQEATITFSRHKFCIRAIGMTWKKIGKM